MRDVREFAYLGDATVTRPDPQATDATAQFASYIYLRDNPAGPHRELWYHRLGCQAWLRVTRNTVTHEIVSVKSLKQTPLSGDRRS
jgi:sarcosine oxidase subunit delta